MNDHRMMQQRAAIATHGISSALDLLDEIWRSDADLVEAECGELEECRTQLDRLICLCKKRMACPYPEMCREPTLCAGRGYCPRDPACNE